MGDKLDVHSAGVLWLAGEGPPLRRESLARHRIAPWRLVWAPGWRGRSDRRITA